MAPDTSPIEARSRSACLMAGSRFSLPREASRSSSRRRSTKPWLRGFSALNASRRSKLSALGLGIDAQQVGHLDLLVVDVAVDADDDVLLDAVALLVAPGRLVDLAGDELDGLDRAAELVDLGDQLARAGLEFVGQRLDVVRAGERVDGVGGARLVGDDLLGAQRDLRRALAGQRQRLVEAVGVQRLRAAAHRGEALQGDAHDVVLGLLGGQRDAAGLRVEAQPQRTLVLSAEALAHDRRPHPPRRGTSRPPGRRCCGR